MKALSPERLLKELRLPVRERDGLIEDGRNNQAGQIFRLSAQSLMENKKNAIGVFMRKLRNRKGSKIAIKAEARKIA